MADIEKQGGKINLTAETLPTGHTISVGSLPSWITVDSTSTSQNWVGKVSQNENANDRSYILTGTVTTNTDPEYEGTTSLTKTWTVTQAGAGSVIPEQCEFNFTYNGSASTNNMTEYPIEFVREGDLSFKFNLPTAQIGTDFVGSIQANSYGTVGIAGESTASFVVTREESIANITMGFNFVGNKQTSQQVYLTVIFKNLTDTTKSDIVVQAISDGNERTVNFYDWFNVEGIVNCKVTFGFVVQ